MKARRLVLCILLSVAMVATFIPMISFANDEVADPNSDEIVQTDEEAAPTEEAAPVEEAAPTEEAAPAEEAVPNALKPLKESNGKAAKRSVQAVEGSDAVKDQLQAAYDMRQEVHSNSYSYPTYDNYSDPYIIMYYPENWAKFHQGKYMYVDFDVYDTWSSYYTIPIFGIFDAYGNLVEYWETDVAYVDDWTNYYTDVYIDPYDLPNGTYQFMVFNVPCDSGGYWVDGWEEWDVPIASVYFTVGHSWVFYKYYPGLHRNGSQFNKCSICKKVASYKVLPGYAKYYVKSFKVSKGKKSFTAKWKKQSKKNKKKFSGYQIRYSTKANMAGAKYVKAGKGSKSKKVKGLAKKTKYYVQARSYTVVGGKTFYSKWSGKKSVKTK